MGDVLVMPVGVGVGVPEPEPEPVLAESEAAFDVVVCAVNDVDASDTRAARDALEVVAVVTNLTISADLECQSMTAWR